MNTKTILYSIVLLVLLFLVGCSIKTVEIPQTVETTENAETFAVPVNETNPAILEGNMTLGECLEGKGVRVYGKSLCPYCNTQKNAFGEDYEYVPFINCDNY